METVNETINKTKFLEILTALILSITSHNSMFKGDHWLSFINEHLEYAVNELDDNEEINWDRLRDNTSDEVHHTADSFLTYYSDEAEALSHFGLDQVQQEMNEIGSSKIRDGLFYAVRNEGEQLLHEIMYLLDKKIDYLNWSCSNEDCESIFVTELSNSYREYPNSTQWTDVQDVCSKCLRSV